MKATVTSAAEPLDLRQRKKLEMMRHVQWTALGLFEARGFDAVTIEEVAAAAGVSAPTIYRSFSTKEGMVLWDEYDPMLFDALAERLRAKPLGEAIRDAIVRPLDRIYAADAARILRRVRLTRDHAGLQAATAAGLRVLRENLARVLIAERACRDDLEADVIAGATTVALEIAIERWARGEGKTPLRSFIEQALRRLQRFAESAKAGEKGASTGGKP